MGNNPRSYLHCCRGCARNMLPLTPFISCMDAGAAACHTARQALMGHIWTTLARVRWAAFKGVMSSLLFSASDRCFLQQVTAGDAAKSGACAGRCRTGKWAWHQRAGPGQLQQKWTVRGSGEVWWQKSQHKDLERSSTTKLGTFQEWARQ